MGSPGPVVPGGPWGLLGRWSWVRLGVSWASGHGCALGSPGAGGPTVGPSPRGVPDQVWWGRPILRAQDTACSRPRVSPPRGALRAHRGGSHERTGAGIVLGDTECTLILSKAVVNMPLTAGPEVGGDSLGAHPRTGDGGSSLEDRRRGSSLEDRRWGGGSPLEDRRGGSSLEDRGWGAGSPLEDRRWGMGAHSRTEDGGWVPT